MREITAVSRFPFYTSFMEKDHNEDPRLFDLYEHIQEAEAIAIRLWNILQLDKVERVFVNDLNGFKYQCKKEFDIIDLNISCKYRNTYRKVIEIITQKCIESSQNNTHHYGPYTRTPSYTIYLSSKSNESIMVIDKR